MHSNITVVTACTGERDILRDDHCAEGAQFVAYVDENSSSKLWQQYPACDLFKSSRRNSRIHKLLVHQYVDTDYSLWVDANMRLLVPAADLIDEWLSDADIAMFKHRRRVCLYEEAQICADLRLDDPKVIMEQADRYRRSNFEANAGLGEACVILRRHTHRIEMFNNAWWSEYCRNSVRDQIGLMYAAKKVGVKIKLIEPGKFDNPFFEATHRSPGEEPWQPGSPGVSDSEKRALLKRC